MPASPASSATSTSSCRAARPLQLAIDLRLQRMVEREIARAVEKFSAIGATAIVMDATNGEILAMASLPTYDPNSAKTITNEALFNRATLGVYEQGSTFKIFNTAMALDTGRVTLTSGVRRHARRSRSTASPSTTTMPSAGRSPCRRCSSISSNIGSAKMAVEMGSEAQRAFFDKIGFLKPLNTAAAGGRRAALSAQLDEDQHHDHRLRPRHLGDAAASGDRRRPRWSTAASCIRRRLVKRTAASDPRPARHPGQDLGADAPAAAAERRSRAPARTPTCRATRSAARPARPRSRRAAATAKKP